MSVNLRSLRVTRQSRRQMLKIALRRYTVQKIRDLVDISDEGEPLQMTNPQRETSSSDNVKLGSPGTTTTLGQFLQTLHIPKEFPQPDTDKLRRSMNACLYHNCQSYTEHGSRYLKVSDSAVFDS
jgi:hypothetical protein